MFERIMNLFRFNSAVRPEDARLGEVIIAVTMRLIALDVLKNETRMVPILQVPYAKQYIAGALLNVFFYSYRQAEKPLLQFHPDAVLKVLLRNFGKDCETGYRQVEEIGTMMSKSGAPLMSDTPLVSRCIVAEMCIHKVVFQSAVPEKEFDVFRRKFLESAEMLWGAYERACGKLQKDAAL